MDELLDQGIAYFNQGYFFEAHDVFEEVWMHDREESRQFYQGLVQLSTGFYHFVMRNLKGTESQLTKGVAKLAPYQPEYQNIDLEELIHQVNRFLNAIRASDPDQVPFSDLEKEIPKLRRSFN